MNDNGAMRFNEKTALIFFLLSVISISDCTREHSYKSAEFLFSEIAEENNSRRIEILDYRWLAFDALEEAFKSDPDLFRARAIFSSFFIAKNKLDLNRYNSKVMAVLEEFAQNIFKQIPKNAILITSREDIYYIARFTQIICDERNEIVILNANFLPFKEYRKYIFDKYKIKLRDAIETSRDFDDPFFMSNCEKSCKWIVENSDRAVFFDQYVPELYYPSEGYIQFPLGRLFLKNDNIGIENTHVFFDFYENVMLYSAIADTSIILPPLVLGLCGTYFTILIDETSRWIETGEKNSADLIISIVAQKIPSFWQPAFLYLFMNPDVDDAEREMYISRIRSYVRKYPFDTVAKSALAGLSENEEK